MIGSLAAGARAQTPAPNGVVSGTILDARTGLPLAGAAIRGSGPTTFDLTSDGNGRFAKNDVLAGVYRLNVSKSGYVEGISSDIVLLPGSEQKVTLALAIVSGASSIATIANVAASASGALAKSSIISKDVSPAQAEQLGYFRAADLLRTLPQVNRASNSETSAPGDDYPFDIRGIGSLETTALLDGHPIGNGISGGYNFQVSPTFGLRNVAVAYGSGGSDLSGVDAVGGVIDMQTIEPSRIPRLTVTQGYGSYAKLATTIVATGTTPNRRTGYALALGVQSIDGPLKGDRYQPGAAYDQSAPVGSPAYNLGVYKLDTAVANRGLVAKIRQRIGSDARPTHVSATVFDTHYWFDKTGNGDLDYLPYDQALAAGNGLLSNYSPPARADVTPMNPACAMGTFLATNAQGSPNGFGPSGTPDGGVTCQTPQQYAKFNAGLQGVGPAWEDFRVSDYHFSLDTAVGPQQIVADAFTNQYAETRDRRFQLPFNAMPGDVGAWNNFNVVTTGAQFADNISGSANDVGIGTLWFNNAYLFRSKGKQQPSPIYHNQSIFFRDAFHPNNAFRLFVDMNYKFASITNDWYFDPRVAAVISPTRHDAIRIAYGLASSQPEASYTFIPISASGFTSNLVCDHLNSVGTGANPSAHPERATDIELAVGHRFEGDSQVQLSLYNENIFNKLQQALVPLSLTGTSYIDAPTLATFRSRYAAACGNGDPLANLSLTTNVNVGHLLASGFDFSGRQRFTRRFYIDYDYSESTARAVGASLGVPAGQLANVPVHKANLAIDQTVGAGIDARLTGYFVAVNNPKNSPGYAYADFVLDIPTGFNGNVNIGLTNAFNSHAGAFGYINHGLPSPDGSPQELFLLPYRQVYVNFSQRLSGAKR